MNSTEYFWGLGVEHLNPADAFDGHCGFIPHHELLLAKFQDLVSPFQVSQWQDVDTSPVIHLEVDYSFIDDHSYIHLIPWFQGVDGDGDIVDVLGARVTLSLIIHFIILFLFTMHTLAK